jgi:hypothetical protein
MSEEKAQFSNNKLDQTAIHPRVEATESNANSVSLSSCIPTTAQQAVISQAVKNIIRRPRRDEPFTTVADPTTIACIVERKLDNWGEEYYPVIGDLQNQVGAGIRSVAFHPCATASGETFIYPQKIDPPQAWANSWNASLAQALSLPPGQWRTVWSDKEAECYQHDLVAPQMENTPEYPKFQEDLEQALTPNIIDSLDHSVLQRLLGQQGTDSDIEEIY